MSSRVLIGGHVLQSAVGEGSGCGAAVSCRRLLSSFPSPSGPSLLHVPGGVAGEEGRTPGSCHRWRRPRLATTDRRQLTRSFSLSPLPLATSGSPTNGNGDEDEAPHFRRSAMKHPLMGKIDSILEGQKKAYTLPHPIWSKEELENIRITHQPPETRVDKAAYYAVQALRKFFDLFSGYSWGKWFGTLDERKWLTRIIFLETIAGVPGMIAAMTRHLKSLRYMRRDHGWIHTLLEEAENERMHLLTFLHLRNPGPVFKFMVVGAQGVFVSMFWVAYMLSPRFCHRFVGYLEEEAVKTYTLCLESIDTFNLPMWAQMPAPLIAVKYWRLPEGAMMRDVILVIRADEAHHRVVNHTLSSMNPGKQNPYGPGK